jgi:hypothetical protein
LTDRTALPLPIPLQLLRRFWVAILVLLLLVWTGYHWFQTAFYDTGYAPEQPIAFYHRVHAGELGIDCKYCHFNADRGKHAGVPPMSVCLGCHRVVTSSENPDYAHEITALLAIADKGSYKIDGTTYHGKPDGVEYEGGVVHWKRVHKLPDFVYFSHQWHVRAGVACQTCHGPVQEMTTLRQYADLTMAWCLDCHRRSNYVGGRRYDAADPSTFAVGSANRDVVRARDVDDPTVTFIRSVGGQQPAAAGDAAAPSASAPEHIPDGEGERKAMVATVMQEREQAQGMEISALPPQLRKAMEARVNNLPIWRLADLPETHRAYYGDSSSFQNAPTQCTTCHQ